MRIYLEKQIYTLMLLCLLSITKSYAQPQILIKYADLIVFNGQVVTMDQKGTITEAIAVRDGRVLAIGTTLEITELAGPQTEKVDLHGRTVTPGFI